MVGVVLVGGSCLLRGGLKLALEKGGTEIVGDYAGTEEVEPRDPDGAPVVYLLVHTPERHGIREELGILRRADANSRITVMVSRLAADELVEVFAAGGDGLVLENISAQALHDSLRLIASGEKVFPSQLATLLSNEDRTREIPPPSPLTGRELEIVRRLALGQSNKEIANELALAVATVKVHVKSLLRKLGLNNRTQAAIWALNAGLVDPPKVQAKGADGPHRESAPPGKVEEAPGRLRGVAPRGRGGTVQPSASVPTSPVAATLAVQAETLLRSGSGGAPSRLLPTRRPRKD